MAKRPPDRVFFSVAAAWFAAMTIIGFGASLIFGYADESVPLPFAIHGVVFALWVAVYVVQTSLIAMSRVEYHKMLGLFAVIVLIALIPAGLMPVLYKVSVGTKTIDHAGFNIVTLILGIVFAAAGVLNRKNAYVHKRLMLFATLVFCVAAADRVAIVLAMDEVRVFRKVLAVVPAIALVACDFWRARAVPKLGLILLAVVWAQIYFIPLDFIFYEPIGESFVLGLVRMFGY